MTTCPRTRPYTRGGSAGGGGCVPPPPPGSEGGEGGKGGAPKLSGEHPARARTSAASSVTPSATLSVAASWSANVRARMHVRVRASEKGAALFTVLVLLTIPPPNCCPGSVLRKSRATLLTAGSRRKSGARRRVPVAPWARHGRYWSRLPVWVPVCHGISIGAYPSQPAACR